MLSKSEILITKRFLFSKKTEGYVSVFSWFSIIGISLGVAAIIIVMSVMNGFRSNLTERLIGVNSHLNIYSLDGIIKDNEIKLLKKKLNSKDYKQIFSSIETEGIVIIGEIGGQMEIEAARWANDNVSKPIVGFIAGQTAPPGRRMGHAGAIVSGGNDTAEAKMRILNECGISVAQSVAEIGELMKQKME